MLLDLVWKYITISLNIFLKANFLCFLNYYINILHIVSALRVFFDSSIIQLSQLTTLLFVSMVFFVYFLFICSTVEKSGAALKDSVKQNQVASLRGKQSKMSQRTKMKSATMEKKNVMNSLKMTFNLNQIALDFSKMGNHCFTLKETCHFFSTPHQWYQFHNFMHKMCQRYVVTRLSQFHLFFAHCMSM